MPLKLSLKTSFLVLALIFFGCSQQPKQPVSSEDFPSLKKFSQNYKKITERYENLLKHRPDDLRLRLELVDFYYSFKDYQKVKELLSGVDSFEAKVILAKTLAKLGEGSRAIEIFERLKFKPSDCEYLYLYGRVLEEKNLFPKAVEAYKKACGPFKNLAQKRLKAIRARAEDGIPPEISKISKEAESFIEEIEGEGAVFLSIKEEIEVSPQNTSLSTAHVVEKVLKERGKELAEVVVGYDSTYERVELEFARTITKDKKVIYAAQENIRDVSRYLNFPLYSNSRAFIISMPSVDVGSFIEYKIKVYSSKLVAKDNFNFIYRLREKYPIFRANFSLITPKNKKFDIKFFNQEYTHGVKLRPSSIKQGSKKVYTWNFKNVKPIIPEYGMPEGSLINPAVLISSFSSWDKIYKWWHSLYKDKVKPDKDIKSFVKNAVKGASSDLDKAKKLYEYVAKNIRYVAVEYGDSGHEPHYAKEVFLNRYGDCKDQAILLTAMMRVAGLKACPVLIPTRSAYSIDKDFPSINFNHAICALKTARGFIFMDPTSETTPFGQIPLGDQDRLVMVFLEKGYKLITTPSIRENGIEYNMEVKLNLDETASIIRKVEPKGHFASGYRWYLKYTHPDIIKEDIQKKMAEISSSSRLLSYKIENMDDFDNNPLLTYEFTARNFLNPAGNLRVVPPLDQISLAYGLIGKEKRKFPIDFEGVYVTLANIKIILPENLKTQYLPSSKVLDNPWFKLETSCVEENNIVNFKQSFTLKQRFVKEKGYQEFKKRLSEAIYLLKEGIILQKI